MAQESRRILVVEDDPGLARALHFSLRQAGFEVTVRYNGADAWEALRSGIFDAVVLDHEMPRMTGVELCRRMRACQQYLDTPVVMVTGRELELQTANLKTELGIAAVYPKPYSPRSLVALMHELVPPAACPAVS